MLFQLKKLLINKLNQIKKMFFKKTPKIENTSLSKLIRYFLEVNLDTNISL